MLAEDFFQSLLNAFAAAVKNVGATPRRFLIADRPVLLEFAGKAIMPFLIPAFSHLEINEDGREDLRVCLWDSASTGAHSAMPAVPWKPEDVLHLGVIRGYNDERFRTALVPGVNSLCMYDRQRHLAIFWVKNFKDIPSYESSSPIRTILHWWLAERGIQLVHAAAVGYSDGGALIVGKSGSGKSTTALSCLNGELLYAADDYCAIAAAPSPYIFSLFATGKVNADHLKNLSHLESRIANLNLISEEKALIFMYDHFANKLTKGFPAKAIFIPRITGQPDTFIKSATVAAGLRALAPSSIFQMPGKDSAIFDNISAFTRRVPSYFLELGSDIESIPKVIADFLRNHE